MSMNVKQTWQSGCTEMTANHDDEKEKPQMAIGKRYISRRNDFVNKVTIVHIMFEIQQEATPMDIILMQFHRR